MTTKILYFTAGAVATPTEVADIAALNALVAPVYEVGVRNSLESVSYGAGPEACDFISGTSGVTSVLTDTAATYEGTPVFSPDTADQGFATVLDGDAIVMAVTGTYVDTVTFTVVAGVITAAVLS